MNKRVVLLLTVLSLLTALSATPIGDHKNLWCHYPPGAWTGVPGTASHVIILSVDLSSDGGLKDVNKHLGHSPSLTGGTCVPTSFNGSTANFCAEGVASDPNNPEASCPGSGCGQADVATEGGNFSREVQLDGTFPNCVCPSGTSNHGNPPFDGGFPGGSTGRNCGVEGQ